MRPNLRWSVFIVISGLTFACAGEPVNQSPSDVSVDASSPEPDVPMVDTTSSTDTQSPEDGTQQDAQGDASVALDSLAGDSIASDVVEPPKAYPLPTGVSLDAVVTVIDKGPWTSGAPISDDTYAVVDKDGQPATLGPVTGQLDPIDGKMKPLIAAVILDDITYLGDADGLHGVLSGKLKESPLNTALPAGELTAILPVKTNDGVDLWLIVSDKLCLYRAGQLYTVGAPGMIAKGAQLSHGGDMEGSAALWVAGQGGLHAIRVTGSKVLTWHHIENRVVDGVHVDAKARIWALSEGEVLRRDAPGDWSTWTTESPLQWLRGNPGQATFWAGAKGQLYRWDAGALHLIVKVPGLKLNGALTPSGALTAVASSGSWLNIATTPPPAKPDVTWTGDIEPIFVQSCKLCHGADGVNTKLDTPKQGKVLYPQIIKNVESGAMPLSPLSPLTPGEIALIKAWKADGFKESP